MTFQPTEPGLEYVFDIFAEIDSPVTSGKNPFGERLHIPITGGTVEGPRLNGRILPGGSDWPLIGPDGHSRIEAHYSIQCTDGTLIYIRNRGIRVSSKEVMGRMRSGETVNPDEYYFRTVPEFDVSDGPHDWLRESIFVASLAPKGRTIAIRVFKLL